MNSLSDIAKELLLRDNFIVVSHASPDGDTLGSATALIRALRDIGKNANFDCGDEIPPRFSYLFDGIENKDFEVKTVVTVDVADPKLLGDIENKYKIDIAIDHHATSKIKADMIYVDAAAAANTMIIFELLNLMNINITKAIADSLYTGLATDTGCFKFSNSNALCHIVAAKLIDFGASFNQINIKMFDTKSRKTLLAESEVYSNMEFSYDDKILCATITQDFLKKYDVTSDDLDAVPSVVRSIEGVIVGVTLKQKENGLIKASIRAMAPANAGTICASLGGGGHRGAGGCSLTNNLEESKQMVFKACEAHLREMEGKS